MRRIFGKGVELTRAGFREPDQLGTDTAVVIILS